MKTFTPKGIWRDTYIDTFNNRETTDWKSNQIQDGWATIAAQMFAKSQVDPAVGLLYLALGEGESSWDSIPPTKDPAQNTLQNEVARIAINQNTDIIYLEDDLLTQSVVPTRFIKVSVTIPFNVGLGDLREFGLVCGGATSVADTGTLFNWVSHPVITRSILVPITILREIIIKFTISEEVTII